jgi:hypothetical protein
VRADDLDRGQFPRPSAAASVAGCRRIALSPPSCVILAVGFDLSSIASLGSVIALVVFGLVTVGHLRCAETAVLGRHSDDAGSGTAGGRGARRPHHAVR